MGRMGLVYRRRAGLVQAVQFVDWAHVPDGVTPFEDNSFLVYTAVGPVFVNLGDWVITGADGRQWVCEAEMFDSLYEAVDAPP